MKVMVMSCDNPTFWYGDFIGKVFTVMCEIMDDYIVKTKEKPKNGAFIKKKDCQVV